MRSDEDDRYERFFGGRGRHPGWREARENWTSARRAETRYATMLRRIARQIDEIVKGVFEPGNPEAPGWAEIQTALRLYERMVEPWATITAQRMLADVSRRDAASWHRQGQKINRTLRREIETAPTGPAFRELQTAQVQLITSLPRRAAERIHELSVEAAIGGKRWTEIVEAVLEQGARSRSHAELIARTEASRAATSLVQARAVHVGSPGYIWRTARDKAVRPRHRELEGSFHRWDEPPVASDRGQREVKAHPGQIYNCRCWPEIVLGEGDIARQTGPVPRNPAFLEALRERGYTTGTFFE